MDGIWATKSEDVRLIVRAISFQDFQLNVILIHQRYRQTDERTDRQTDNDTQSQYCALHYSI